jgi:hypothetical protein
MTEPRARFGPGRRRPASFLNRVEEFRIVRNHVDMLDADPGHLQIFEIVGLGGVGKTRLLTELKTKLLKDLRHSHLVWVSLDAEASATATGPLRVIRNQLSFDCLLFDAALLTYWAATGLPSPVVDRRGSPRGLAMKAVEMGASFAGVTLPLTFAVDLYTGVGAATAKRRRYARSEFAAIDDLRGSPSELFARLPHYLGVDVERRVLSNKSMFVCFYDSYDKQAGETVLDDAPWLREFIATLGLGVHVISTRDRLGWDPIEWGQVLRSLVIGALPDSEARRMVREELGGVDATVEDRLVDASHRIPFFLQASIDICRTQIEEHGSARLEDLPSSPASSVEYLLNHLDRGERMVAIVLATVQYFDDSLYAHLVRTLNLTASTVDLDEFAQWFFVETVDNKLFKMHDLLTQSVRESGSFRRVRAQALEAATLHLALRASVMEPPDAPTLLQMFHSLVSGWQSDESMPTRSVERMIDLGYVFHDLGYWRSLSGLPGLISSQQLGAADVVARYFSALASRRTVGPAAALEQLEPLGPLRTLLGRHAASFDLEVAYLSEISGNYGRARTEFSELNDRAVPFDPSRRDHVRARLYHADMLTMDGRFRESSWLLAEAYEAVGPSSPMDWAELVRHRAHAFRFSLLFENAEHLYLQALQVAHDSPSMTGKLYTDLVQTRCWLDPLRALEDANLATRLNLEVGNALEVAKCDAASAIALARAGDPAAGADACESAHERFDSIGYPAGVAFALQARVVVEVAAGRPAAAAQRELAEWVRSLGTYGHLCLVPAWLREDASELHRWSDGVEWITAASMDDRLESIARLRRRST